MLRDFKLETFFSKWEFNVKHHMCASDMETMTINQLLSLASNEDREKWDNLPLKYIETYGMPELRTEIAKTYDNISQKNILAFAGAEEGIFAAMHCILKKDDHAIVITPNYQSSETIPDSICDVTGVSLDSDNNWDLDIQKILDAIKKNTRLIAINFPHNPTGKVISKEKLDTLIEISRKHDIYLFSDEVYRLMERREEIRLPQIADIYEKGLSLNVMSKAYGLPGLRIGWIASKDIELLDKMERMKHYLSICNSSPSEVLSIIALKSREKILERNRKIISDNLSLLSPFFEKNRDLFDWKIPDGGCIGYPKYLGDEGVELFCENLIENHSIMLLPSSVYQSELGATVGDHFRIGYGRIKMKDGLEALEIAMDQ